MAINLQQAATMVDVDDLFEVMVEHGKQQRAANQRRTTFTAQLAGTATTRGGTHDRQVASGAVASLQFLADVSGAGYDGTAATLPDAGNSATPVHVDAPGVETAVDKSPELD